VVREFEATIADDILIARDCDSLRESGCSHFNARTTKLERGTKVCEEMTSLERYLATIRLAPHDRVPIDLHNFMMTVADIELPPEKIYQDGQLLGRAQLAAWKRFGHDMLLVENGTAALAEACGCEVSYIKGGAPLIEKPLLKSLEEVASLRMPDPWNSPLSKAVLDATRFLLNHIGSEVYILGRADQGPFDLACMIAGPETLMTAMAMGESDDLIFELLEYASDAYILYARIFKEMGCPATSLGEALCSPDVISPKMFAKYCLPYGKKVVSALQSDDFAVAYHTCGNTTRIISGMVETGARILEFDYKCDKAAAKRATAGKTTLLGPIDPSGMLQRGTVAEVETACREALEVLAPGGGFILGPGCALPGTTPPANIDKLIECAKLYGKY
jgi:uroporphyrinogen decarboxylase